MKPGDFFVGAHEFFSVLVPGAILVFLLLPLEATIFGPLLPELKGSDIKQWSVFFVFAYLFGHLLHHTGGIIDRFYDKRYAAVKRRLDEGLLLRESKKLAAADLGVDYASDVSTFEWAGSYLRVHSPTAAAELERAGGESKFFRSLALVAYIAVAVLLYQRELGPALIALGLGIFSFKRFCKLRWDNSQRTYQYFLLARRFAPAALSLPKNAPTAVGAS